MIRFERLPYTLRSVIVAAYGYQLSLGRYGKPFNDYYSFLEQATNFSEQERNAWCKEELLRLLQSAKSGSSHYSALSFNKGCAVEEVIQSLPVLDKAALRSNPSAFFNHNEKRWLVSSTSGTSGSPMKVEHCKFSMQRRFALLKHHLAIAGVSDGAKSVRLSGRIICDPAIAVSRPWLYVPSERQLLLSSYHLNEEHKEAIVRKLLNLSPEVMDGYSSGVLETLRLVRSSGARLDSLKVIVTTAETLSPSVRQELEELSGAKVLDYYAASEGVPIIQQCQHGIYHVRWESGIFEVLDNGEASFDGSGELVVTSFIQDRTPLIRYRTGDFVQGLKSSDLKRCGCGLKTPTIESVEGRIEDMVLVRGGKRMGMFTYRTLKEVKGLKEAQVVQRGYDDFHVKAIIDAGAAASDISQAVKSKFDRVLGYPVNLDFVTVNEIEKGPNGKARLVINEMQERAGDVV